MKAKHYNIDIDNILQQVQNLPPSELERITSIANIVYAGLDIPIVVLNSKEIKSNILIAAMYLIGKQEQKEITNNDWYNIN